MTNEEKMEIALSDIKTYDLNIKRVEDEIIEKQKFLKNLNRRKNMYIEISQRRCTHVYENGKSAIVIIPMICKKCEICGWNDY